MSISILDLPQVRIDHLGAACAVCGVPIPAGVVAGAAGDHLVCSSSCLYEAWLRSPCFRRPREFVEASA